MRNRCPACGAASPDPFFELTGVPVHGNAVLPDAAAARAVAIGDHALALCPSCGVVVNLAFDPTLLDGDGHHEDRHSPRFAAYVAELTGRWVDRFGLVGRHVVEVGCGSGDFAAELLDAGVGSITGVDPHFTPDRVRRELAGRLTAVPERFTAAHVEPHTAALVCRHTLEHVPEPAGLGAELVAGMHRGDAPALLSEVPDLDRILVEGAFWSLRYEHCSYFTPATLRTFLLGLGLADPAVRSTYADRYIVAEARLGSGGVAPVALPAQEAGRLDAACRQFAECVRGQVGRWRGWLDDHAAAGDPVVVWGGGAKGLTFLNVVVGPGSVNGNGSPVRAVVDINPGLQGRYTGGLGLPICGPDDLVGAPPRSVLLANPVHLNEVRAMLDARGLASTDLLAI